MKWICLLIFAIALSCSSEPPEEIHDDRFLDSQNTANQLGEISRLTDDNRSVYPTFAPGDSIVYFNRLLVSEADDTTGRSPRELIKPFGIKIANKELYTLSGEYKYSMGTPLKRRLDDIPGETVVKEVESPDGKILAYETIIGNDPSSHTVYLARDDSTVQLTFGNQPCFIDRFSNTGRYLNVICGRNSSTLVIFDINTDIGYKISNDGNVFDYASSFSSDDKMMIFIRSDRQYSLGPSFFGDIWLLRFHD